MTVGKRSAKAITPSQAPDCVSCQASQPVTTRCIQVPMSEIALPAVKIPKFGCLRTLVMLPSPESWIIASVLVEELDEVGARKRIRHAGL
jgi:hypothetical protein